MKLYIKQTVDMQSTCILDIYYHLDTYITFLDIYVYYNLNVYIVIWTFANFFSAVFSKHFFFTRRGHFKIYRPKGICSIALKLGQ